MSADLCDRSAHSRVPQAPRGEEGRATQILCTCNDTTCPKDSAVGTMRQTQEVEEAKLTRDVLEGGVQPKEKPRRKIGGKPAVPDDGWLMLVTCTCTVVQTVAGR